MLRSDRQSYKNLSLMLFATFILYYLMIIGGFLLAPAKAFSTTAVKSMVPRMRFFTDTVSFNKKNTQIGPKITSVRDKKATDSPINKVFFGFGCLNHIFAAIAAK